MLLDESEVGVGVYAVEKVRLLVVIGGEDNVKDDSFKNLFPISTTDVLFWGCGNIIRSLASPDPQPHLVCYTPPDSAYKHQYTYRPA